MQVQTQPSFDEVGLNPANVRMIGASMHIKLIQEINRPKRAILYRLNVIVMDAILSDRAARNILIVQAVNFGAKKSSLARALRISRQTIDNQLNAKKHFGYEGLVHAYNHNDSKDRRRQRRLHKVNLSFGNDLRIDPIKAEQQDNVNTTKQESFSCPNDGTGMIEEVKAAEQPYDENHGYLATRYAGRTLFLVTLINKNNWLRLAMSFYGPAYNIIMVFLLMVTGNIASIEQMKNVSSREAGLAFGIKNIPSKPTLWKWFYAASSKQVASSLISAFFRYQVQFGLVDLRIWFIDGHLLSYTGKRRIRLGFSTQRQIPIPGRTSMVTCDDTGRIVDYEIQEGKGDLRGHISALGKKWKVHTPQRSVLVFDREGHGNDFFIGLVDEKTPFVTWEKDCDRKKLDAIEDSKFVNEFELNGKSYSAFEGEKIVSATEKGSGDQKKVTLRRIYLWNKSSKRRTCGVAWTGELAMTTVECAKAVLNRWGASENTFKHIITRHPWHYNPGLKFEESEHQDIANPEIKRKAIEINATQKELHKYYKQQSKTKEVVNADGIPRQNSMRERVHQSIVEKESKLSSLKEEKKKLPLRVNISSTGSRRLFSRINNEGKYLFDYVSISVWNARKQMVDWLSLYYNDKDDVVDLLYAITKCHGWIKSTDTEVIVRLEPLEQPKRRLAQEQLCRKLTSLVSRSPNGKRFFVEVGEDPAK